MDSPPVVGLRSKLIVTVVYGFGDASGTGLGATFTCGKGFSFRIGVWGACEANESSNWKEFSNIVDSLEDEARLGNLQDSEVFMFTDNSTVESCSIKGSSSSPKLLELIIRLKCLTTEFGIKLNIFHVSGTRMIAQGTDRSISWVSWRRCHVRRIDDLVYSNSLVSHRSVTSLGGLD
jgi:hypothetical protein